MSKRERALTCTMARPARASVNGGSPAAASRGNRENTAKEPEKRRASFIHSFSPTFRLFHSLSPFEPKREPFNLTPFLYPLPPRASFTGSCLLPFLRLTRTALTRVSPCFLFFPPQARLSRYGAEQPWGRRCLAADKVCLALSLSPPLSFSSFSRSGNGGLHGHCRAQRHSQWSLRCSRSTFPQPRTTCIADMPANTRIKSVAHRPSPDTLFYFCTHARLQVL